MKHQIEQYSILFRLHAPGRNIMTYSLLSTFFYQIRRVSGVAGARLYFQAYPVHPTVGVPCSFIRDLLLDHCLLFQLSKFLIDKYPCEFLYVAYRRSYYFLPHIITLNIRHVDRFISELAKMLQLAAHIFNLEILE